MKIKLESGREVELKELSVDERDELMDSVDYDMEGESIKLKMMHSTMTKFIRIGVKDKVTDDFLKGLNLIFVILFYNLVSVQKYKSFLYKY